jgi:stage II sporulation protein D (peptidoglycan lytic transglycosylase)
MRPIPAFAAAALLAWLAAGGPAAAGDVTVRVRGADGRVSRVELEPYVERAVAGEVWASWPPEALKAQAVVARTYALHQRLHNAELDQDVESSVLSQRFARGPVSRSIRDAAQATRGQYLSWSNEPILAAFHSSAGGRTASALEVWGEDLPYLRTVDSPDDAAPDFFWSYQIGIEDLRGALREAGFEPRGRAQAKVVERTSSGRAARIDLLGAQLSGRDLREVLGGRALRSALFDVRVEDGSVRFLGSGAGHGVGLCQWGARELALRGKTYAEILAHYYPGTGLTRLGSRADLAVRE